MRALPQYNSEFTALLMELLENYKSRPLLHIVLNDRGRFLVMLSARHLHNTPDRRGHRLSKVRLAAFCEEWQICSRGRARAIASTLRWAGLLTAGPSIKDGRARPIVPTAEMNDVLDRFWRRLYEMIARLFPQHDHILMSLDDNEAFVRSAEWALISLSKSDFRLLDHAPRLRALAERNGGLAIAVVTMFRIASGRPPQSVAALARQFSVSRAHIRQVVQIAEMDGLLSTGGQSSSRVEDFPLFDELANLVASLLVILIEAGSANAFSADDP
ncbi:MAG TPA: hypothetical protein VNX29_24510 [Kaistia sp.]|nr:hypothetical protein [Kaistia sp.]